MEKERYRRVTEIVADLVDLDARGRSARLSALHGEDRSLCEEVESLLNANDASSGFLQKPAYLPEGRAGQEQSPSLTEGRILGRYQVLQRIGAGGMGEVYRGRDLTLQRDVALKVLPREFLGDAERLGCLRHEARMLAALNHPNISSIYGIEEFADGTCLVLELVDGEIPVGPLPVGKAIDYALQIAEAIQAAHDKGIVHRDLKPANIKVTRQGKVKVLDFGLAKVLMGARLLERIPERRSLSLSHSLEGGIAGTPPYLSPEQARGEQVDHRTDIWAFGCLLYELLTGERAFRGDSVSATISAVLEQEPDWTRIPANTPAAVRQLILRCLQKDAGRRVQSIAEVHSALERAQRKALSWPLAAGAFLAVALLISLTVALRPGDVSKSHQVEVKPLTSYPGNEQFPAIAADGGAVAFTWTGLREEQVDLYVRRIEGESPLRLTNDKALECYPAWSPDGALIAFLHCDANLGGISKEAEVFVIDSSGGPKRRLGKLSLQAYDNVPALGWMPDGKHIVVRHRKVETDQISLFSLNVQDRQMRQLTSPPTNYHDASPAISPDGRSLAFVRYTAQTHGDIYIQDLGREGSSPRRITHDSLRIFGVAWRSDGELIYLPGKGTTRALWRVTTDGRRRELISGTSQVGMQFTVSRDGRRLVYSDSYIDSDIARVNLSHARVGKPLEAETLIASTQWDGKAQYSPDGKKIAFASARSGHFEIWVADADGSNARQITFWQRYTGSPRWSPGGDEIAADSSEGGNANIYVINVKSRQSRRITSTGGRDVVPSWSRDGKWIYFASDRLDGFQVWKALAHPAGDALQAIQVTKGGGHSGGESMDGKRFYYSKASSPSCVWTVPAEGGEETEVICPLSSWQHLAVFHDGFFYAPRTSSEIWFFSFARKQAQRIFDLRGGTGGSLGFSPDRRWLLVTRTDLRRGDLHLVDNLN